MSAMMDDLRLSDAEIACVQARRDRVSLATFPRIAPPPGHRALAEACQRRAAALGLRLPRTITWIWVHGQYDLYLQAGETRIEHAELRRGRITVFMRVDLYEPDVIRVLLHELKHCGDAALMLTGRISPVEAEQRAIAFSRFARQGWR